MFNSNQTTITIGGNEYTLTLNRKGFEAIEKYTQVSKKKDIAKRYASEKETKYVENISLDEDPFADMQSAEEQEEDLNELMETLKRILWICLWEEHHLNIDQVRELLIVVVDENGKLEELNSKINQLIEGVNKQLQTSGDYLKNIKALKALK